MASLYVMFLSMSQMSPRDSIILFCLLTRCIHFLFHCTCVYTQSNYTGSLCQYYWATGSYGQCSSACGVGTATRSVSVSWICQMLHWERPIRLAGVDADSIRHIVQCFEVGAGATGSSNCSGLAMPGGSSVPRRIRLFMVSGDAVWMLYAHDMLNAYRHNAILHWLVPVLQWGHVLCRQLRVCCEYPLSLCDVALFGMCRCVDVSLFGMCRYVGVWVVWMCVSHAGCVWFVDLGQCLRFAV